MDTTVGILDQSQLKDGEIPDEKVTQPAEHRSAKCTDAYCLFVFLFLNVCLWTLSGWSYYSGNPLRLRRGWDVNGDFCGVGYLQGREYTYFPLPLESLSVSLCLSGCPSTAAEESICLYDQQAQDEQDYGCFNAYASKPFFNKYCLPATYHERRKVMDWLYSADRTMTRVVGDLARAWDILAIGALIAGGAMVLYLVSLHFPKTTIFLVAVSVPLLLFLFAVFCFMIYEESWRVDGKLCDQFHEVQMEQCDEGDIALGYRDLCWVMIAVMVVTTAVLACLLPKFMQGLKATSIVSKVHRYHPLFWLCPLASLVIGVAFYTYFLTLLIYQVSCGDHATESVPILPGGQVEKWQFTEAERVLVFFDVGMILWWFSALAHMLEYIIASMASQWYVSRSEPALLQLRRSLFHLFRYHLGSVLVASIVVPAGRLMRNICLGLKSVLKLAKVKCKWCMCLHRAWFRYMTSDSLAYIAITGGSFLQSAHQSYALVSAQKGLKATLNAGNSVVWLFQLVVTVIAPVFVIYWIHHESESFRGQKTLEVSSVTAMAIYVLVLSWHLAQVYGGFVRGLFHGSVLAYLENQNKKPVTERVNDDAFSFFSGATPHSINTIEPTPKFKEDRHNATNTETELKVTQPAAPLSEFVPPPTRGDGLVERVLDLSQTVDENKAMVEQDNPIT